MYWDLFSLMLLVVGLLGAVHGAPQYSQYSQLVGNRRAVFGAGCPTGYVRLQWNKQSRQPSAQCVAAHVALLRGAGFMRSGARVHSIYRVLVLLTVVTYLVQECVYAYRERNDMAKLSRVMFLLLCHITSIAKQIVFHTDADRIDDMIHSFDDPQYQRTPTARALVARTATSARRLVLAYSGCAVLTCSLWLLFPVLQRAAGQTVDFPFWTGLDNTDSAPV